MSKRWIGCDLEADYFGEDRKEGKSARKRAKAKDRSKYKKTDQQKLQKAQRLEKLPEDSLAHGIVLSVASQGVQVESTEKIIYWCSLRGILKKEKTDQKNLVAVGDKVRFKPITPNEGVIYHVEPRTSILSRADNLSRRKSQLIAVNIDQVLIIASVVMPALKPPLVDRYIIAAIKGNMTPIIVVNKIDLLQGDLSAEVIAEKALYQQFIEGYRALGIDVIPISVLSGEGIGRLKEVMKGKSSVFSGQSGVGKSSLINVVAQLDLKVGAPVQRTGKGAHTTSRAELIPLAFGGWCVDTPGIKSFGVWDLKKEEVESYFSEIHSAGRACKYPDCSHTHEEGCAVIEALQAGKISALRYASYEYLIETLQKEHLRR